MKGFVAPIEAMTEDNKNYRQVLYTGKNIQLVMMTLQPHEDIGAETHHTHDQFFRVEEGRGEAIINSLTNPLKAGDGVIVPAGARHNIRNTGNVPMKLYTLYAPPQHEDAVTFKTKEAAEASDERFDGRTTE